MSSEDIIQTLKHVLETPDAKLSKTDYDKLVEHCDSFLENNYLVLKGIPAFAAELEERDRKLVNFPIKYTFKHEKLDGGLIRVSISTFVNLIVYRRSGLPPVGLKYLLNSTSEEERLQKFNDGSCFSKRAEKSVEEKGNANAMIDSYLSLESHFVCCNILRTLTQNSIDILNKFQDECIIIDKMFKCICSKRETEYETNYKQNSEYESLVYMLDILLDIDAFNGRLNSEFDKMSQLSRRFGHHGLKPMPNAIYAHESYIQQVASVLGTFLSGILNSNNKRQRQE